MASTEGVLFLPFKERPVTNDVRFAVALGLFNTEGPDISSQNTAENADCKLSFDIDYIRISVHMIRK
jgi:hypothetical protein